MEREDVSVYGSGGFTTHDDARLREQFASWAAEDVGWMKMKVGTDPGRDLARARGAKAAIGDAAQLPGAPRIVGGLIRPDPSRPGHGSGFRRRDAERFAA